MSLVINDQNSMYRFSRDFNKRVLGIALHTLLLGLWLSLSACGDDKELSTTVTSEQTTEEIQVEDASKDDITAEVQAYKEKWLSHEIKDYQIEMQKLCFCPPEAVKMMIFEISNDEIKTARYADSGDTVDPSYYTQYNTVEGLFALVEQAAAKKPAELSISYDDKYGYIKELTVDYRENIADDEFTIITSNMRPDK